jgi:hypothetical protein
MRLSATTRGTVEHVARAAMIVVSVSMRVMTHGKRRAARTRILTQQLIVLVHVTQVLISTRHIIIISIIIIITIIIVIIVIIAVIIVIVIVRVVDSLLAHKLAASFLALALGAGDLHASAVGHLLLMRLQQTMMVQVIGAAATASAEHVQTRRGQGRLQHAVIVVVMMMRGARLKRQTIRHFIRVVIVGIIRVVVGRSGEKCGIKAVAKCVRSTRAMRAVQSQVSTTTWFVFQLLLRLLL